MKPIYHEVQTKNGIPTLSDSEIEKLVAMNPMREEKYKLTAENITHSLESLKLVYAEHTGREKKEVPPGLIPGAPCPICKNEFFRRTGPCLVCVNCGESSSCG